MQTTLPDSFRHYLDIFTRKKR